MALQAPRFLEEVPLTQGDQTRSVFARNYHLCSVCEQCMWSGVERDLM